MKDKNKIQICKSCVMDTSDENIIFDKDGICNHCVEFKKVTIKNWFPNKFGETKIKDIIKKIKNENHNEFNCLVGISGGVDSCYLTLKMKSWGLRPLVLHVDAGWNSEIAVSNIEKVVKDCKFDLYTKVINWEDMRNLQIAYLESGISNLDAHKITFFLQRFTILLLNIKLNIFLRVGTLLLKVSFHNLGTAKQWTQLI